MALQSSNVPSTCSSKSGVGLSAIIDCIGNTKIACEASDATASVGGGSDSGATR